MKKLLLITFLLAGSLTTFAQVYQDDSPVSFGIKGGVNLATLQQSTSGSNSSSTTGSLTSFHAGVFADFKFGDSFSIQPSLLYTGKGATEKENESNPEYSINSNVRLTLNYLELPVYALYHTPVGDNDFFIGAGPFVGYGLSGKEKGSESESITEDNDTQSASTSVDQNVKFGSDSSSDVKRIDYGISAMAGFKFSMGFLVSVYYDLGLANIDPDSSDDSKIRTRVAGLSVGYSF
jgi:hypothetical protein